VIPSLGFPDDPCAPSVSPKVRDGVIRHHTEESGGHGIGMEGKKGSIICHLYPGSVDRHPARHMGNH